MALFNLDETGHPIKDVLPKEFVNYWKEFYDETKYPTAVYEQNLNIGGQLDHNNLKALLEWKLAFIPSIQRVEVVNKLTTWAWMKLKSFNDFRSLETVLEEHFNEFWNLCQGIARKAQRGFVIGAFLLHIARPMDYPILDQHVLRAYRFIQRGEVVDPPQNLETYLGYKDFFDGFCKQTQSKPRDVDKALMAFGKQLQRYPLLFYQTG